MTRALVVGYGSIGQRHASLLEQLGCQVAVVSRRNVAWPLTYGSVADGLAHHTPQYVVIASATGEHGDSLSDLVDCDYRGTVLVEKPLFAAAAALPEHCFNQACVAYNLRFHPIVLRLRALLEHDTIVSVNAHVGQYLPHWRPGSDYRKSYSARADQGGGVLRDLSHELDYLTWLVGGWEQVTALGGHFSELEITSDDVYSLLIATPRCPVVSIHLNYLDRDVRRHLSINTMRGTLEADLVKCTLSYLGASEQVAVNRNDTYRAMHEAMLGARSDIACSLAEGLAVVQLIEGAAHAALTKTWVSR